MKKFKPVLVQSKYFKATIEGKAEYLKLCQYMDENNRYHWDLMWHNDGSSMWRSHACDAYWVKDQNESWEHGMDVLKQEFPDAEETNFHSFVFNIYADFKGNEWIDIKEQVQDVLKEKFPNIHFEMFSESLF
jgi:hypothetical protein